MAHAEQAAEASVDVDLPIVVVEVDAHVAAPDLTADVGVDPGHGLAEQVGLDRYAGRGLRGFAPAARVAREVEDGRSRIRVEDRQHSLEQRL